MKENSTIYYKSCQSCGRPQTYCKGECCGKPQGCQCKEYGPKACGCIRQKAPECPYEAVIPSVTVESVSNLKDLADCFVHVSDINTTFYIDDKHRIMTTWAGLVSVEDYDFEANPLNLRGQIAYDAKNNVAAIYDKQGANYIFQISDIENDYMLLENKPAINGVTLEGDKALADLNIAATFDTVADMQSATNLVNGSFAQTLGFNALGDGGGAIYKITDTGTVDNLYTFAVGDSFATAVNDGVRKISLDQLPLVGTGVYTLGKVKVDNPVQFPRIQNRGITIVNTTFELNTPVLFPAYNPNSYFVLPNFIGCTFTNVSNGRVVIASGGNNIVASKITGCNFINVDMASGNMYLQDFNFAECYIQSYQAFLENTSTIQARFVNCSAESECKQIIKTNRLVGYFSGTYEGNEASNYYFVDVKYGDITLQNAWIEGSKFLTLTGGTTDIESTILNLSGSTIVASQSEMFHFGNASKVNLFINGTRWSAYNVNSRFTNTLPSSFNSIIGSFISSNAPTYNYPIGGVSILSKQYATNELVENLENRRFISEFVLMTNDVISSGGYNLTLPVGNYLMVWARGADDVPIAQEQLLAIVSGSDKTNSTLTRFIELSKGNGSYITHTTFTVTKTNATDTTFTLNILPDSGYPHSGNISLIKIY